MLSSGDVADRCEEGDAAEERRCGPREVLDLGNLYAESRQPLQGSFSAVSKPNFASKYSLELAICSKRRLRKGTWKEIEKENLDK